MIPQHDCRSAYSDLPRFAALQFRRNRIKIRKERLNESEQFFSFRRQSKRPALKESDPKEFLQLRHLSAHCRLLDAIGNVSHRFHDSPITSDVDRKSTRLNSSHEWVS